jgi:hypothetical protein
VTNEVEVLGSSCRDLLSFVLYRLVFTKTFFGFFEIIIISPRQNSFGNWVIDVYFLFLKMLIVGQQNILF